MRTHQGPVTRATPTRVTKIAWRPPRSASGSAPASTANAAAKAPSALAKSWEESNRSISQKERDEAQARDGGPSMIGIPEDHPLVRDILAKHKGEPLLLCLGGCEGETVILDRPAASTSRGVYTPSSAWAAKRKDYGNDPGTPGRDVVCVAGCLGAKGSAVWKPVRQSAYVDRQSGNADKADKTGKGDSDATEE